MNTRLNWTNSRLWRNDILSDDDDDDDSDGDGDGVGV